MRVNLKVPAGTVGYGRLLYLCGRSSNCSNSNSCPYPCTDFSQLSEPELTCTAAHVLRHDSAEVPEARLTAVALLSPYARLTGALARGWITCALV